MDRAPLRTRLRRIEGQVQGVQRMLAEERRCEEVLTQLLAIRSGIEQVALLMTEARLHDCIFGDGEPNDPQVAAVRDILKLWIRSGA